MLSVLCCCFGNSWHCLFGGLLLLLVLPCGLYCLTWVWLGLVCWFGFIGCMVVCCLASYFYWIVLLGLLGLVCWVWCTSGGCLLCWILVLVFVCSRFELAAVGVGYSWLWVFLMLCVVIVMLG